MLLKRNEQGNIVEALYESSNIVASKYDKSTNQLKLTFKSAVEYIYENVSISDYHKLELADSQGKVFNKHFRAYPFVKGDKVDINEIFARIESVKVNEINELGKHIAELATLISNDYIDNGNISESNLADIARMIKLRVEKTQL